MPSRNASRLMWFAAWLLVMAGLAGGLLYARQSVMAYYSSPQEQTRWRQWKAETERMSKLGGPVARRVVTSDQPPALVLMRDSFPGIMAAGVAIGSFLFAFLAVTIRGSIRTHGGQDGAGTGESPRDAD